MSNPEQRSDFVLAAYRRHRLTQAMADALFTGENGEPVQCTARTEKALINRTLIDAINSDLTEYGREVLAQLRGSDYYDRWVAAGRPARYVTAEAAAARPAIEGVIVGHLGTTWGSLPEDADHPDVIATLAALHGLAKAELHGTSATACTEARGVMVIPRGDGTPDNEGRVGVYWLEGGQFRERDGSPRKVELGIISEKLRAAGWRIEHVGACVIAWRPENVPLDPQVWQHGDVVLDAHGRIWTRAKPDDQAQGWPWASGAETTFSHGRPYASEGGHSEEAPVRPLTLLVRGGRAAQTVLVPKPGTPT